MILEYWVPSEFLGYLDTWARTAYCDTNGQPYWYDCYKGVSVAYIEPQYSDILSDETFESRCASWFTDYDPNYKIYHNCQYFTNRSNLFLNIAIMISISNGNRPRDRQYIGQAFIPIECLDSYSVETSGDNHEYIKLNISQLIKAHLQKANSLLVGTKNPNEMKQYIVECKELYELLEANPED